MPDTNPIALLKKFWWLALLVLLLMGGVLFLRFTALPGSPEGPPNATPIPFVPTSTAEYQGILRLTLSEPGIYALPWQDLARLGLQDVDPANLRLFNLGQPQPLWVSGTGEARTLYFYGHPLDTPYTAENVYFLTTAPNALPPFAPPTTAYTLANLPALHLEENTIYLPRAEAGRTWFWKTFTAPKTETLEFTLPAVSPGEAALRVTVFGNTEASAIDPDHHLRLSINGTLLTDHFWDGRGSQLIEQSFDAGLLVEGLNTLTLELPGDTGSLVETVLLDWVELDYPHPLLVDQGRARFHGTGANVDLSPFPAPPLVFDLTLTGDGAPVAVSPSENLQFPTTADHEYLAVAPDGFLTPLSIFPTELTPDLRKAQAAYIAIGPPDLLAALQPLLDHRAAQGLTPIAVPLYAIYDQFGGGAAHPEAIHHFLQYAVQNWPTPPQYVVLVGDSTYDPRGYQSSSEINRVPSFFRFTFYGGETVTDVAFAQMDNDNLPDLIMGRIPARTPAQVTTLVEKTLAYEQTPPPERSQHILAIADGQEASFTTDAETFLSYFPDSYTPVLLTPPKGDTTAAGQITSELEEGVLFMSYFGHGSIMMLGKDRIFSVEDGVALTNGDHLPVMINITCLAGLFTHPEAESLTEVMLWNPDGGAVAALAATSLTIPSDQAYLTKAFVEAFAQNPDATLGELFLAAQRMMPVENEGVREVLDTFLLFGDPALRLP
jgi:hypothetical protein